MLRQLTNKQKLRITGISAILALILCYELAISRTFSERRHYREALRETADMEDSGNSLQMLKRKEEALNAYLTRYRLDTLRADKNLLSVVSEYCRDQNLVLKEYKPYSLVKKDSIRILTRTVTIEGPFIPCLRLLYQLERSDKVGKISSADFKSFTDMQDKKTKLNLTLFVQNLVSDDENH